MNNRNSALRLAPAIGTIATLIVMLFSSSSSYHLMEKGPQEVVSNGVEIVLLREEDKQHKADNNGAIASDQAPRKSSLSNRQSGPFLPATERHGLNGLGTHLRI